MNTLRNYTGAYQAALRPQPRPPRVGSLVRIHDSPDARELDDYRRHLADSGLCIGAFVRYHPRSKLNVFRIEKDTGNHNP